LRRFVLLVLLVLFAIPAFAGDILEKIKEAYDFDNWPGKDGKLRQGIRLKGVDLAPYEIASVRDRLATSGETILRYRVAGAKKHVFEVAVRVHDSVAQAQEALVAFLGTCTVRLPRGSDSGVAVGDMSFVGKDGDAVRTIAFVRNNVFIRVSLLPSPDSEAVVQFDAAAIAAKIDEQIKQEEEAAESGDLKKPVISEFTAATGQVAPDTPVEIKLEASDPREDTLEIRFDEGGGMVYEEDGRRYFKAEKPGVYTVTVYVVNEHFQVSRKSITITVE
jgi:hypothetical protein